MEKDQQCLSPNDRPKGKYLLPPKCVIHFLNEQQKIGYISKILQNNVLFKPATNNCTNFSFNVVNIKRFPQSFPAHQSAKLI